MIEGSRGRPGAALSMPQSCANRRPPNAVTVLQRVVDLLFEWQERSAQRRELAALDDRMLRDIGLSRYDVAEETTKPFWQP